MYPPCDGRVKPNHLSMVTTTRRPIDLWQLRYWVRCWDCNLRVGPFRSQAMAGFVSRMADTDGEWSL